MPQVSAAARPTTVTSSTASTTASSHCEDRDGESKNCARDQEFISLQSSFANATTKVVRK